MGLPFDSTHDGIGCSHLELPSSPEIISYDYPTRPIRTRSVVVRAVAL